MVKRNRKILNCFDMEFKLEDFVKVGVASPKIGGVKFMNDGHKEFDFIKYEHPKKDWGNIFLYTLIYFCLFGIFYLVQFL